jgi:molybdopterin biosynthesis enzyme
MHPRLPLALRDGWAVLAELTLDAGPYAPMPLPAARRIDVGEPLPQGADAVAPFDAVELRGGAPHAVAPVGPGEGVLPAGADADRRQSFVPEGRRLTRVQAAALAAAGVRRVLVCEPRLRIARARAVGDDVIDAIIGLVASDIAAQGGRAVPPGADLEAAFADDADAVIVVGGTGSGRDDRSVAALARLGRVEVHGIALAPGETTAFGFVGARPALLLPGRLDAALAAWLLVGRRLLARLAGSTEEPAATAAKLARKISSPLGLAEMVPVELCDGVAQPIASGYVRLAALARANGWVLVPAESEGFPSGAEVMIRAWP